ncbi:uncharacterized protein [Phaseolus vulgaris]|uniref:uncharacterized protein n=1 Tax=Phaseolus vulgaris TaxID=3885 RepID=UPI0035CBC122
MPGIDPDFLCHHLTMDPKVRPVRQRRRKFNEERRLVVQEETKKLLSVGHIREIQYPEWLANVVLVKKANGKWLMCVDFTDLNKACPKDSYPLPSIDALVDSASGCKMLSFLDAFSGYNQIKMHPRDESKMAFMTETLLQGPVSRYQSLEKAALEVVLSARRLRHYFHSFTVVVVTDLPIQKVLQKPDVAGRMVCWAVELSEFDIQYEPRGSIKGQVYADFVTELSPGGAPQEVELGSQWMLSVDGSSNQQGSGAGIVLEGPNGVLIEQALRFAFKASNNQAECEALIVGMLLAKEMGAQSLLAKSDSQLVTEQVTGEYQAKDPQMTTYLKYVEVLKGAFVAFELVHVPREQNARADLLAKLASSGKGGRQRTVIQETLKTPRNFMADNRVDVLHISAARGKPMSHRSLIQDTARTPCISTYAASPKEEKCVQVCALEERDTWMTPYRRYIADGILPAEPGEGKKIKKNSASYTLVNGVLFRHGFTHPILTCVSGDECTRIISELHEGICGSHVGGRSLASKVIRAEFYWPSVREDCVRYA